MLKELCTKLVFWKIYVLVIACSKSTWGISRLLMYESMYMYISPGKAIPQQLRVSSVWKNVHVESVWSLTPSDKIICERITLHTYWIVQKLAKENFLLFCVKCVLLQHLSKFQLELLTLLVYGYDFHTWSFYLYSKTCLKRNAIVPAFFFRFHRFQFYKGLCFNKTKYKKYDRLGLQWRNNLK